MGRKGVSKRKPKQTTPTPLSSNNASGSVSSVMQAAESQPVKSFEPGKAVPFSNSKKKTRKG